ncbi:beta-2-glycoprotein 1 [Bombina bombina]|uniref:beta-2-glycoprotein 1 n=1 Tax=Bombina bombina TaxID=8345 RepID=UPI00235A9861|nr:beta-2-glycoprotein 1 [Bombina bombina]
MMLGFSVFLCLLGLLNSATAGRVCSIPPQLQSATYKPVKNVYEMGDFVVYSCLPGYVSQGSIQAFCLSAGIWNHATLTCRRKRCGFPGPLENGKINQTEINFQSWVTYSCNKGYVLHGANQSMCTDRGTWTGQLPTCGPITCSIPPVPENGKIASDFPKVQNISSYLDLVKYECLPRYVMFGNDTATCTASGNWSDLPECRDVKCNRPTEIENGFISFSPARKYDLGESVTYGCKPTYVLDGLRTSICEKDGEWTPKPTCRAPCRITTKKAVVIYNGRKLSVDKISNHLIQHGDTIAYYCKNKAEKCAYMAETHCVDGNFTVPSCYKEQSSWNIFSTDPSKMQLCANAS